MYNSFTLPLFLGLTVSTLVGSFIYKNKDNNFGINNLIENNRKSSVVINFLKTDKDLIKVKSNIKELSSDLSEYLDNLISANKLTNEIKEKITRNHLQDKELNGKIEKKDWTLDYLKINQKNAETKASNQKRFKTSESYKEQKITRLTQRIKDVEEKITRNTSNQRLKEHYENKKQKYENLLKEVKKEKENLENTIKGYIDKREIIKEDINKNQRIKDNFQNQKEIIKKLLEKNNKNKNEIKELLEKLQEQIGENQKIIVDLNQIQKNLENEKNKLHIDILYT